MKTRLSSLAVCLSLLLSLFPATAAAVDIGPDIPFFGVGGVALQKDTYYQTDKTGAFLACGEEEDGWVLHYDSETETLTLQNAALQDTLHVPGGTSIRLVGENTLCSSSGVSASSDGGLAVGGDGSLDISSRTEGICVGNSLHGGITIGDSAALCIHNPQSASLYTPDGDITIKDSAQVTADGDVNCLSADKGTVAISDEAKVTIKGDIRAQKISIADSAVVEITDGDMGLNGATGVEILDGASVTVHGRRGGVNSFGGSVNIEGAADLSVEDEGCAAISVGVSELPACHEVRVTGKLTLSGFVGIGIRHGNVLIDGGVVNVKDAAYGLYAVKEGDIAIQNGADVTVSAARNGIYPKNGEVSVSGSTVRSTAGEMPFSEKPLLTNCTVYVGADEASAALVEGDALNDETVFTGSGYVRVERAGFVTGVTLDRTSLSLHPGGSAVLTATVSPADATNPAVSWSSSNPSVAAVQNGTVTAESVGTAQITAVTEDGGLTAGCTVTVTRRTSSGSSDEAPPVTSNPDGSTTTTVTDKAAGTVTETTKTAAGVTGTTVTGKDGGIVSVKATVPAAVAAQGSRVTLPVSVHAADEAAKAVPVSIAVGGGGSARIEIPVTNVSPGDVAVLVRPDGTEELIRTSIVTETGVALLAADGASVKIVDNAQPFDDVPPAAWYGDAVAFVSARGILSGTDARAFQPEAALSRGMAAQMLYNLEDRPATGGAAFRDVTDSVWYADAVNWAAAQQLVSGYGDGSFRAEDRVTREQLALILYRYADGKDVSLLRSADLSGFRDGGDASGWAAPALEWAVANGLLAGGDAGALNPGGAATRAEAAKILQAFCRCLN